MEDYSVFVPDVHFEQIPIKNLVSNQDYQRNLSLSHIKKAAENFDLCQINPVKVSRRDGINYVFNGQHTIEIVALVSGSRDTPVWCMVYDYLKYEHEAEIFANQMKFTRRLQPYEIFMANIEAGNDKQLIIRDMVNSFGLTISQKKQLGAICAISTLEEIYDKYGLQCLERVIRLILGAWEGDMYSFSANMMNAVARIIHAYGDSIRDDIFKEKLGDHSIREITRSARERQGGSLGFAETLLYFYNKRLKYPLNPLSLYAGKRTKKPITSFENLFDEADYVQDDEIEDEEEQEQLGWDMDDM